MSQCLQRKLLMTLKLDGVLRYFIKKSTAVLLYTVLPTYVYHALIKSRLQYGIVLWENANQSALKNFNKMHNRAIRYIIMQPYRTRLNKLYAFSKLLKQ